MALKHKWCSLLLLLPGLFSCSFQLRGFYPLPFTKLFITGLAGDHLVANKLMRLFVASKQAVVVKVLSEADALLDMSFSRQRSALSLTKSGTPQEFILTGSLRYVLKSLPDDTVIASGIISTNRAMSYSDRYVLAKQAENDLLYDYMSNELVDQLLWRLSAAKRYVNTKSIDFHKNRSPLPLPPP